MSILTLLEETPFKRLIDEGFDTVEYERGELHIIENVSSMMGKNYKTEVSHKLASFLENTDYYFKYYPSEYKPKEGTFVTSNIVDSDVINSLKELIAGNFSLVTRSNGYLDMHVLEEVATGKKSPNTKVEVEKRVYEFIEKLRSSNIENRVPYEGYALTRYYDEYFIVQIQERVTSTSVRVDVRNNYKREFRQ